MTARRYGPTPGPWRLYQRAVHPEITGHEPASERNDDHAICTLHGPDWWANGQLIVRAHELEAENNKMRALIANSDMACMYCGLPAADLPKCPHGFPGCGRADDMIAGGEAAE